MATLNLFPARIRFTNTDGTLTPEAYRALQVLFERVGGPLGDNGADTFGDLTGVASLDMSLTDTVTQPVGVEAFASDVTQPVQSDRVVGDVEQPLGAEPFMPDVVQPPNEAVAFDLAAAINAATSKTTPVDADVMPLADSASGFTLKKLSWANLKATLATWINGNLIPASFTSITSSTTGKVATTIGVGNATPSASGSGVSFPAIQNASSDANTLDDYEEGTWTPVLSSDGTPPTVSSYSSQMGAYTKIGNRVLLSCNVRATVTAIGSGNPVISGLPFSAAAGVLNGPSVGIRTILSVFGAANYVSGSSVIFSGSTYSTVADSYLTFSIFYEV